jgi:PERQ amino acid-rich with GYF domain-containing protein
VNSPLKPPNSAPGKEGAPKDGLSLRKASISNASQNSPGPYGLASPTGVRSGRRREPSESYPFPSTSLTSPSTSRFPREESSTVTPPASLTRRRTDFKDSPAEERDKEKGKDGGQDSLGSFATLKRTTTAPFSAGLTGPSSPWSSTPQTTGFSPMGSFGNFALGPSSGSASDKRPALGGIRAESRFKGLMSKESSEDVSKTVKEKGSLGSLSKVPEATGDSSALSWREARPQRATGNESDSFPSETTPAGSAALGGNQDNSPPRTNALGGFTSPIRQDVGEDVGFGAFGMTTDNAGMREIFPGRDNLAHQMPQGTRGAGIGNEPMSPTSTNPYHSPEHGRTESEDVDTDGSDIHHNPLLPGLGSFPTEQSQNVPFNPFGGGLGGLGRISGNFEAAASDRSQTSSAGPSRPFPSLGGLGALPGLGGPASAWSNAPTIGTPSRDRQGFGGAFGEGPFASSDLQSPGGLAGLGTGSVFNNTGGTGSISRGTSKMGSLFPAAMQEQMRTGDQLRQNDEPSGEPGDRMSGSGFGRAAFGSTSTASFPPRQSDSPFRAGKGTFEDYPGHPEHRDSLRTGSTAFTEATTSSSENIRPPPAFGLGQGGGSHQPGAGQAVSSSASSQPPAPQQRTMVMPDRMQWVYRDPQGNVQGPWSGLEMHDWYKAGFFSPELLVKKVEDPDYEPLAQLIRRIGNSREPFLVPQIGIPHGPPTSQSGWGPNSTTTSGVAQPPFPNSFPSFGTTLTAEQQNALERRKQEEQWLMARQKEHLAQQQMAMKMGGASGMMAHQLQHHSSAHSLHSQPSYGSITSPSGYQPSPTQGPIHSSQPVPGFFDNSFRAQGGPSLPQPSIAGGMERPLGGIQEEQLPNLIDRMSLRGNQMPHAGAPAPFQAQQADLNPHDQQVAVMLNERARQQREQADHDASMQRHDEQQAAQQAAERLQQFHDLRIQQEQGDYGQAQRFSQEAMQPMTQGSISTQHHMMDDSREQSTTGSSPMQESSGAQAIPRRAEELSLREQVQKAASAKQTPAQSPWGKVDSSMPLPFPPPQSQSPLPAPAAQRKQNLADTLHIESRSQSATPSVETPSTSLAPWAKDSTEAPKGPSLKEIQAAEAKKAAQQEELAAAAKRAALEKEILAQANAAVVSAAPGLPTSSTWASGSSMSPVTPSGGAPSAWAKPLAGKGPGSSTGTKKTLSQIQKEEEARKQRQVAAASTSASTASASSALAGGKRYAELASKHAPGPSVNTGGGAWTTVGASGKAKTGLPASPASRNVSGSIPPATMAAAKSKPTPVQTGGKSTGTGPIAGLNAMDEFKKWVLSELKSDLLKGYSGKY